jgi:hypothetical protein
MTNDQFDALSALLRLRGSRSQEAARLVLVDGYPVQQAASEAGVSPASAAGTLAAIERGLAMARKACGIG